MKHGLGLAYVTQRFPAGVVNRRDDDPEHTCMAGTGEHGIPVSIEFCDVEVAVRVDQFR